MPGRPKQNGTRVLRKAETLSRSKPTSVQLESLAHLVKICASHRIGLYMGTINTSGGIKLRLYGSDENAETYLAHGDDPAEVLCEALDAIQATDASYALDERLSADGLQGGSEVPVEAPTEALPNSRGTKKLRASD